MKFSVENIATVLREARRRKKLSQRQLGEKIGIPQSHISRIEKGEVDLQASSLIELSRALDLELMLLPRQLVPSMKILQSAFVKQEMSSLPAYRLDEEREDG